MAQLACRACGRRVYMTVPFEALFGDERRCPRCGAMLEADRRVVERREVNRRQNPPDDPGPPPGMPERRKRERRKGPRRRPSDYSGPA